MTEKIIYSVFEDTQRGGAGRHCLGVCSTNEKALELIELRKERLSRTNNNYYHVVPYTLDDDVSLNWGITGTHG